MDYSFAEDAEDLVNYWMVEDNSASLKYDWRADMLAQLNNLRRSQGLNALRFNNRLHNAAGAHALDQSRQDTIGHIGSDGSDIGDRVRRTGYDWIRVGENAARGQRHVDGVMHSWINSPSHYRNLVNQYFTEVGFGRATGSNGQINWVQNFATPRA
jgi:uncharacterized protein YkwD